MCVTEAEARVQIEAFKASVPGVERWRKKLIETASNASPPSVETIGGRRRILPSLGPDAELMEASTFANREDAKRRFRLDRSADERRAVNTACQGSAADVVKRAMIAVFDELDPKLATPVLQIHDELLFEVDASRVVEAARAVRAIMERAGDEFGFTVPLPVKVSAGANWGELVELVEGL